MRRHPDAPAGMTLIELLITVTVFTAVLGAVSALLHFSLQIQQRTDTTTASYEAMERTFNRLERDLESATRFFGVPVVGSADRLEFAQPGDAAWVRVVYRLAEDDQGLAVIREAWRLGEAAGGEPLSRETLMRLSQGRFAFGVLQAEEFVWAESWDGEQHGVPRLVKFTGVMAAGSEAVPVPLARMLRSPAGNLPELVQP